MGDYIVYEHVFPNGKRYIGISKNGVSRWRKDGKGYKVQTKIAKAIEHFGWDNIEHNVILKNLSHDQANECEKFLISLLDTVENGYNITKGGDGVSLSYLNSHVLEMIRLYKRTERNYNKTQRPIIDMCLEGHNSEGMATWFNFLDRYINEHYPHINRLEGVNKSQEYWYYMSILWARIFMVFRDIPSYSEYLVSELLPKEGQYEDIADNL